MLNLYGYAFKEEWNLNKHMIIPYSLDDLSMDWKRKKITSKEIKEAISEITHKEIKDVKSRETLLEQLLTPEEIMKIADHTLKSLDKTFVLAFYESACRIGEILPTKIKDIEFDKYGCRVNSTGKTGFRPVRLCASAPALSNWLGNHSDRTNSNAFLFWGIEMNNYKKMFSHDATRKMIFESSKGSTLRILFFC